MRNKKFCALSPTVYYTINFPPIKKKKRNHCHIKVEARHIKVGNDSVNVCVCVVT